MAHSDSHLTGGIMALIVMSLIFDDDDEPGPAPSLNGDQPDQDQEEKGTRKR